MLPDDPIRSASSVKETGYLLSVPSVIIGEKRYVFESFSDWTLSRALPARFWRKVELNPATGCWLWMGSTCGVPGFPEHVYGQLRGWDIARRVMAHRFAYETVLGKIPAGFELDHRCEVKLCVNPNHLEVVTHRENCRRRNNKGNGYRFSGGQKQ